MRTELTILVILMTQIVCVSALTDEHVVDSVKDYCAGLGYPNADVSVNRNECTGWIFILPVEIRSTALLESGGAKAIAESILGYIISFDEVDMTGITILRDEGYGTYQPYRIIWSKENGVIWQD